MMCDHTYITKKVLIIYDNNTIERTAIIEAWVNSKMSGREMQSNHTTIGVWVNSKLFKEKFVPSAVVRV